ncbi:HalOD1 output domain-containing protein [Halorubellus sp. PRR65]|uniref:HalOD1 output domain-containing protein n=1 Tax=Halorubellus sp. PRR65 TaxID=3098148 RepID=UPI002B262FB6|nr:HalOD1 output domain-containing protein [Halorubellus sp. PRR65]
MNPIHDIVTAVADATGQSHTELPPLLDTIDPDAVVAFVDSAADDATLAFEYCDHRVTVGGNGAVETKAVSEPVLD